MPLIKNFSETNIFNSFILLSLLQTIILSFTFGIRELMNDLNYTPLTKFTLSLFYNFMISFISLYLMFYIFGFGKGTLAII